jgi:hypothetical protein
MPEYFGNLRERGPAADHLSRQTVPKKMCGAPSGASDSGSRKRGANDVAHRSRAGKTLIGCIHTAEDTTAVAAKRGVTKVSDQRLSDLGQQRQRLNHPPLSVNADFSGPPTNVLKFEENDLASAQPESGEKQ